MKCFASAAGLLFVLISGLVGCVPWRDYPVSPVIEGQLTGARVPDATLRLEVRNQTSASLGAHRVVSLEEDGRFRIDPIPLRPGVREVFKLYTVVLSLEGADGGSRVIWRSEWHRGFFDDRLELQCELQRPSEYGQVCRVVDPARQRSLVSYGQREFMRSCIDCHAVGATGNGLGAEALRTEPPDLTRLAARRGGRFDREWVHSWIDGRRRVAAHGVGEMPTWAVRMSHDSDGGTDDMIAARIDAIVAYLESIQRPDESIR